jgi:ribose/xylose/arabinose/galactoside ABC-type transport system permease subunit
MSSPDLALRSRAQRAWRLTATREVVPVFAVFLLGFVLLSLLTETFLSPQNQAALLRNISWLAIVALGESLVVITGGIDLSVGATMALAGLLAARALQLNAPVPVAFALGLGVGLVIGLVNGILTAQVRLPPFVVTLATMSIARGVTYSMTRGWPVTNLPPQFAALGQSDLALGVWRIPTPFVVALLVTLLVWLLLTHTVLGSDIYAVGAGERALAASGVDVMRLKVIVYVLCGLLAAFGGLVLTARLGVAQPTAAIGYEVDVVAATVIGGISLFGGIGTALGVLLGAGITQMLYNGLVLLGGTSDWQVTIIGAAILIAVLLDYWRRKRGRFTHGSVAQGE